MAACAGGATAARSPYPTQTYGAIVVTLVRPSSTPFVAPTLPVGDAVTLRGSAFDPPTLAVVAGTPVTWTNRDVIAHTSTSGVPGVPDGAWDGPLYPNGTFSFTFTRAGTYTYFCRVHASMYGSIVVR